jgi:integrase
MDGQKKPRRPKGSGGIRNRGTDRNPRWLAYYRVPLEGSRREVSKSFGRKADAEAWLAAELQRLREGRPTLPTKLTVGELLDEWLEVRRPNLEPSTFAEYRRIAEHRIKPHLDRYRVRDLRPNHVARMLAELRKPGANRRTKTRGRGLSETSLQHTYTTLRSALDYAIRQRIITHNVMADVDRPRRQANEMAVWSADDLAVFLTHIGADRLFPLLRLASHTGTRRSELLGLRWPQLDLAAGSMTVVHRRTRVGYQMIERAGTKTRAGARTIDLDPATTAVLNRWREAQAAERQTWGIAYIDSGYVFTAENGEALHADHVAQRFDRLVGGAGVPIIRFHDLRHTHATLLLKAGVPVHVVAQRLGHASPALTLSIYSHVLPRQQSEAAAAFAALVDGAVTAT